MTCIWNSRRNFINVIIQITGIFLSQLNKAIYLQDSTYLQKNEDDVRGQFIGR